MAEQSGLLKAESSATTSKYTRVVKPENIKDTQYLDKTVFSLMNRNLLT